MIIIEFYHTFRQIYRNGRLVAGQKIPKGSKTLDDFLNVENCGIDNDITKTKKGDEVDTKNNNENKNENENICSHESISVKGKQQI